MQPTVERVGLVGVVEPDPAQPRLDRLGLRTDLADQLAHVVGQELGVDRIIREQRVDELLVVFDMRM